MGGLGVKAQVSDLFEAGGEVEEEVVLVLGELAAGSRFDVALQHAAAMHAASAAATATATLTGSLYNGPRPRWAPRTVIDLVVVGDMVSADGLDWLQNAARAAGVGSGESGLPCQMASPFDPVFAELYEHEHELEGADREPAQPNGSANGSENGWSGGWSIRCVLRVVSPEVARAGAVAQALRRAGRVLCMNDVRGGGDWAVTLALARGFSLEAGTLVLAPDNPRLESVAQYGADAVAFYWANGAANGWAANNGSRPTSAGVLDVAGYADGLVMGTTRALTLGRGRSAVGMRIFYTPPPKRSARRVGEGGEGSAEGGAEAAAEGGFEAGAGGGAGGVDGDDSTDIPQAYSAEVTGDRVWMALDVVSERSTTLAICHSPSTTHHPLSTTHHSPVPVQRPPPTNHRPIHPQLRTPYRASSARVHHLPPTTRHPPPTTYHPLTT